MHRAYGKTLRIARTSWRAKNTEGTMRKKNTIEQMTEKVGDVNEK